MTTVLKYMLVMISAVIAGWLMLAIAEAIKWTNSLDGYIYGGVLMGISAGMVYATLIFPIQLVFVLLLRHKFSITRALLISWPPLLLIAAPIQEWKEKENGEEARIKKLEYFIGGELPKSIRGVEYYYCGGIDPTWIFTFDLESKDVDPLIHYKPFELEPEQHIGTNSYIYHDVEQGDVYHFYYMKDKKRAKLAVLNY